MASVGNAFKVDAAVSASGGSSATGGSPVATVYTAPSSGYAVVQIVVSVTGGGGNLNIGGLLFAATSSGVIYSGVYIGPGQSITVQSTGGAPSAITAVVTGAAFKNS